MPRWGPAVDGPPGRHVPRAMNAVRVPAVKRYPSPAALLTEPPRAGLDVAALAAAWPLLTAARRGDGHPVLVLPGLMTGDPATLVLRTALRARAVVIDWCYGFYNHQRRHSAAAGLSPINYETAALTRDAA